MNAVVVVVAVLVVSSLIASALLLRSISASPKRQFRRNLTGIRRIRKDIRAADPNAVIRVDRDDWAGTSDHLG
jgi:hypothetical protein